MKNNHARDGETVPSIPMAQLALRQAALELGIRVPVTPDEIAKFEESIEPATPRISDEEAIAMILGKSPMRSSVVPKDYVNEEVYEDLAMAARFGETIPPEILAKMEADRAAEEEKLNGDKDA